MTLETAIKKAIEGGWIADQKAQMYIVNEGAGFYNNIQIKD